MQDDILEKKSQDFTWDISDPPDDFYDIIENLITVAEDASMSKTNNQLVSYGLKIIRSTRDFENGLLTWYNKSNSDQTCSNFKVHFSKAHENLIKIRGISICNTMYHQANETVIQLSNEFLQIKMTY